MMETVSGESVKKSSRLLLPGVCRTSAGRTMGKMKVINMSVTHIIIEPADRQMIPKGTEIEIEFTLDDKPKSIIQKDIKVLDDFDGNLRCAFIKPEHYDRLGPYLHFNYLDNQQL